MGPTSIFAWPRAAWLANAMSLGLLSAAGGSAFAAGYERLQVLASGGQPSIQVMVWSPCAKAPDSAQLGPYVVQATQHCAVAGDALPLVVMSHGQGGTLLGHHDTAAALADAGFVVVTFNHPGDSHGDESAAQQLRIFESRPRDGSRVISFMLQDWPQRQHLDPEAIGLFGFSRGGYTALVMAGAVPSLPAGGGRFCARWWSPLLSLCRQIHAAGAWLDLHADPRIRAAVVADPLNLFDAAGLKPVRIPVQLWASEQGGDGVALEHVEAVRSALPQVTDYHVARGAGHFAFLAPCPPAFKDSAPHICADPEGFDRASWHRQMNSAVVLFFERHLKPAARSANR